MDRGPIFVVGAERSGTSLMFALLASHPNIAMTRRTNLWRYFFNQYGDLRDPDNLDRCLAVMARYKRLVILDPDFERLRRDFLTGQRTYARLFTLIEEQYAECLGKPRWGDKSLNTERFAEPIFGAYPGARMLHMVRDPRDRYASSDTRWKGRRGGIGAGTAEWLASMRKAGRNTRRYPGRYTTVRYETLATDPEGSLRRICHFIGEDYTPEMLSMEGATAFRDRGSNSSYEPRSPGVVSTSSIGRYRRVLSPSQIAFVQVVAGRQLSSFGYEAGSANLRPADRLRFAVRDLPIQYAHLQAWRVREALQERKGEPMPAYRLAKEEQPA